MEKQTVGLIIINVFIIWMLYILLSRAIKPTLQNRNVAAATTLLYVFCVFAYWGADWFHYLDEYNKVKQYGYSMHMEEVYSWIITHMSPNYLVFRLIVWGSGLFLLTHAFKILPVPYVFTLYLFSLVGLIWFSYARVGLAMAMQIYGVAAITTKYEKKEFLFPLLLLCCSVFFHKSAFFGLVCIICSFFLLKVNKIGSILILIGIPLLLSLTKDYISMLLVFNPEDLEGNVQQSINAGLGYMNSETIETGVSTLIHHIFERSPYYITALICLLFNLKCNHSKTYPLSIRVFANIMFIIVIFSSLFAFNLGNHINTSTLYGRFLRFGSVPMIIMLSYFFSHGIQKKLTKVAITAAILSTCYTFIYTLYNCYMLK